MEMVLPSRGLTGGMANTKETKREVMKRIKDKLENAKLNLIYVELEEMGIKFNREYTTVEGLRRDLKGKLSELDYNKLIKKIEEIELALNNLVSELENKSTNAFTKVMTSDLAKSIAKTLGITLAGRTLLLLAPTVGTKVLVGAGLAGYGLYRMIKNRKEIVKINESNELNNILMELETTKEDGKYIETRFSGMEQGTIREFLNKNNIAFDDTGYISLRQTIYNLDDNLKRSLCEQLNNEFGKGLNIENRIKKARKKLNVVASSFATASSGLLLGTQVATAVNTIDPAMTAGVLNGTVLSAWIQSVSDKEWVKQLSAGLGLIGTEVLEHIPVVGGVARNFFAAENLAAFASIGAAGGLAVGAGLGIASVIKKIHSNKMSIREMEEYLKLDSEKYKEIDRNELVVLQNKIHEPKNLAESAIVDIVTGYMREYGIRYEGNPQTVKDIIESCKNLPESEKRQVTSIIDKIRNSLDKDPEFIKGIKKAGKISICLFTTGLAALSVYDIIKGGSFLPELSQKLFPQGNIHTPVEIPEDLDADLDTDIPRDVKIMESGKKVHDELVDNKESLMTEKTGDYDVAYGANYGAQNPSMAGTAISMGQVDYGQYTNLLDALGIHLHKDMVIDIPLLNEKLNGLSAKELYDFYRYFGTLENDGSQLYTAIKEVLSYERMLEKATTVITEAQNLQKTHNIINDVSRKLMSGAIPFAEALTILGILQKGKNDQVVNNHIKNDLKTLNIK